MRVVLRLLITDNVAKTKPAGRLCTLTEDVVGDSRVRIEQSLTKCVKNFSLQTPNTLIKVFNN